MLSIHNKALERVRRLFPFYQTGEQGSAFHHHYQPEHNKRIRQIDAAPAVPATSGSGGAASTPATQRPPAPIDLRFHKEGSAYVTVSPLHFVGDDPVPDPAQKHTWADGYTECLRLEALFVALGDTTTRIKMLVFAGTYPESLTTSSSRIDIIGIGKPELHGNLIIASTTTQILVDNILFTQDTLDRATPLSFSSIQVLAGAESGYRRSDIQFTNCEAHANSTAAFVNRWTYFYNCEFFTLFDASVNGTVNIRFNTGQTKWVQFAHCHLHGFLLGTSDYRARGNVLVVDARDVTGAVWTPNSVTYGSGKRALTGVVLDHCEIDGWTNNYGWNLQYQFCFGIEGQFQNSTTGSYHHRAYCNSDQSVNAYTWFDHTEIAVRYMVATFDEGVAVVAANCNIWIRDSEHTAPDNAGTPQSPQAVLALTTAAVNCITNVYCSGGHSTHAQFFFQNPVGVEGAIIATPADPTNTYQTNYIKGYLDF